MNDIITELFYQYFRLSDNLQEEYKLSIDNQKLEEIKATILRSMPEDKHDFFFKYESLSNELAISETEAIFKFGVKIGIKLKQEIDELLSDTE